MWSQSRVPGGGGVRDNAPRAAELSPSKHDGTICVPSGGTAVPREARRCHPCTLRRYDGTTPCTLRRYDGTTPVPSGGTTVPPLYPQEVRRYHPCTWRWYACEIPVVFYTEITLGKMTVVPRAGTRVVPLYLIQVQGWYRCTSCRYKGGTVVPRAGTRVVPSYLLEVHYPFCSTQYICFAI